MLNIIRTGLDAANHEIAVLSHNLANAGTAGFKRSNTVFEDHYGDNIAQLASKYTSHGTVAHARGRTMIRAVCARQAGA